MPSDPESFMSYHYGKFNWFEHLGADLQRSREFYEALFGWNIRSVSLGGEAYQLIRNGDEAIGGLRNGTPGVRSHWNSFLSVADVDASWHRALVGGAKAVLPPADFGGIGRTATLADPAGAFLSLWHGSESDRPDPEKIAVADWFWNELMTQDVKGALEFYETVLGYSHDVMQSPTRNYYILKSADGKPRGGIVQSAHVQAPSAWLPYVRVEDADAIAARVGPLGGSLMMAPLTVAGVGRIGALFDPLGAALGFIHPAAMA
jgi:uncharacterized protein